MMLSHANVSRAMACFEHSNFFKVTALEARPSQLRLRAHHRQKRQVGRCSPKGTLADPGQRSNYELFNCNNSSIGYWSQNYHGSLLIPSQPGGSSRSNPLPLIYLWNLQPARNTVEFCNAEHTFFIPATAQTRRPGEGNFPYGTMKSWDFGLLEQLRATQL
jgi:hypothetical protein